MRFYPKLVVSLAALAVLFAASTGAQAKKYKPTICKSWVSGTGLAVSKPIARLKARLNWKNKVVGLYGASWANFSVAKVGAFPCGKYAPTKWSCTVRAKPCKILFLDLKRSN